jgi:hypothetical protein
MQLLVTRGIAKPEIDPNDVGDAFVGAKIEILDWERKEIIRSIDYTAPPENLGADCNLKFTGGGPYKGKWFQTTSTEVVIYNTEDWSVEQVISHPSFHDLHGCCITDDEIAVVNTGLEMIQFFSHEGELLREVNTTDRPTWERFDKDTDYRFVRSTKPHAAHPNHAFRIDGQWWATRCSNQDAICLANPSDTIKIEVGQPHDGLVRGDFVYFTTTNAHIVVASAKTRKVEQVIDLNVLNTKGGKIGWCRGLEVDGKYAYVGFSFLRKTKWAGAFQAAADFMHRRKRMSHVDKIDMETKELVDAYDYERNGTSAVFTLMDYDRVTGKID